MPELIYFQTLKDNSPFKNQSIRPFLMYLIVVLVLLFFVIIPLFAYGSEPIWGGVGVNTHYLRHGADKKYLKFLNKIKAKYVIDNVEWREIEQTKGVFVLDPKMVNYINRLNSVNIKPVIDLLYSNNIYTGDDFSGPISPEVIKAFGQYVAFLVGKLKGKVYAWQIWNEPDCNVFWQPTPNPLDYSILVRYVAPIIRKIDPGALIVAGGTAFSHWEYLNALETSDVLKDIDVVSFHWYTQPLSPSDPGCPPWSELNNIYSFVNAIKNLGKRAWITEMGYPTSQNIFGVTELQQATYIDEQIQLAKQFGVEVCLIYDLIDDGPNPLDSEHRFGLFRLDGTPKPAAMVLPKYNMIP